MPMAYGLSLWEERFCTCRIETAQWMNFHLYWENNGMTEIGNYLADQAWTKAPQTSSPARKDPTCGIFHLYTYDIENTPTSLGKSSVLTAEAQTRLSQRSAAWQPWRAFVALFALFTLGTVTWLSNVTSRWHFKLYCSHFLSPCQEVAADFGIMKDGTIAVTFALVTTSLKPPMTGLQEPYMYLSEKKTLYPQCPLQFPVYAHYGGFPHFSLELNSPKSCMNLPPYKCGNNDVRGKYSFWYKFSRTSLDTPIFVVKFSKIYVWSKKLMRASALIHKNRKFPVAIIFLSSQ